MGFEAGWAPAVPAAAPASISSRAKASVETATQHSAASSRPRPAPRAYLDSHIFYISWLLLTFLEIGILRWQRNQAGVATVLLNCLLQSTAAGV